MISKNNIDHNSREYIQRNPIRSSIGALGYGTVQAVNVAVDSLDLTRDVLKLARLSLKSSVIEAETEALMTEIEGYDQLEELRAQLAKKKA